jgi:hypothetical protein
MSTQFEIKDSTQGPWTLDLGVLMIPEALELKRYTGLGPRQWIDALGEDDPLAVRFAFYLASMRAGETDVVFADVDVNLFDMSLTQIPDEAEQVNADLGVTEANADVVPTGPATESTGQDPA